MDQEMPDKKPVPGNDLTGQVNPEHIIPEKPADVKEQDLDDLVHTTAQEKIPENEEFDADDAVHNPVVHTPPDENANKDPDDLVHGR